MSSLIARLACASVLAGLVALCPLLASAQSGIDAGSAPPVAGNYCVSCHTADDARLAQAGEWRGPIEVASTTACPGVAATDEQIYYVERQLLANTRLGGGSLGPAKLEESYARLLDYPRTSAGALAAEAQMVGYAGGKTYAALSASLEAGKQTRVLIAAALITAFLLFAFGWGLRITLTAQPAALSSLWRPGPRVLAGLVVVLILFALPLFRAPPATDAASTAEEQAAQAELDKSSRAGAVADRAIARAAMLGEIAATWAAIDRPRAEAILEEALAAERAAASEAAALWGRARAAEEAAVGSAATQDKAKLVADELLAARGRAWGLRLIAQSWAAVDPERANEILAEAEVVARANNTVYGELDLRAIAAARKRPGTTAAVGPASANSAAAEAVALYRSGEYARAWDTAGRISDDWERARGQCAIAAAWGNADAARSIAIAPLRDRALRLIAIARSDAELAGEIASPYERVTALAGVGRPAEAAAHADALAEKSPLVDVIVALAPTDPAAALPLVDRLDRESDRAEGLTALAIATGDPAIIERGLGMAAAARVRGDALAPARASLALARGLIEKPGSEAWGARALAQAYELTKKISVKYK